MTETDFQKYVSGLITARLAKPKKIRARHSRYWSEIVTETYQFNRDNIETEHVKTITKDQIKQFYKVSKVARFSFITIKYDLSTDWSFIRLLFKGCE